MIKFISKVVAVALATCGWTAAAQATPIIQILENYGNQYNNGAWIHTFDNVYGNSHAVPPDVSVPIVTSITDGVQLTFSPWAFLAQTNSATGVRTQTFDGTLSFLITFDSPVLLATKLSEGGAFASGDGTTSVRIDVAISPLDGVAEDVFQGVSRNDFVASGDANNWSLKKQYTSFNNVHSTYLVSIDNILQADVPSGPNLNNAWIDKKFFTLTFNTDGSGGPPVPEPATLGVLATGCLALLARRRRA